MVSAIHAITTEEGEGLRRHAGKLPRPLPLTTEMVKVALQKTRLTVQISTKLNRSHLVTGEQALIFPCLGRTEVDLQREGPQLVSTENSMGVVQTSQGVLEPDASNIYSQSRPSSASVKANQGSVHLGRFRMLWPPTTIAFATSSPKPSRLRTA